MLAYHEPPCARTGDSVDCNAPYCLPSCPRQRAFRLGNSGNNQSICGEVKILVEKTELVDHPTHYGGKDNPYEVIKVLEAWLPREQFLGWLRGTVIKYQARAGKKPGESAQRDLEKAIWYSNYEVEFLKRGEHGKKQE